MKSVYAVAVAVGDCNGQRYTITDGKSVVGAVYRFLVKKRWGHVNFYVIQVEYPTHLCNDT